jgi:hypothetical protein
MAENSLTKAIVYFKDGNKRTFHSRDLARTDAVPNRQLGISRLRKMVYNWKEAVETAILYDNRTGEEVMKFREGGWI